MAETSRRWLLAIALANNIATTVCFAVSLDDFIPRIEREASAKLKEPVTIKSLKFGMLPVPHITVDGITVGKTEDIKLGTVIVTPAVLSLMSTPESHQGRSKWKSLVLTQKAIDKIPVWSKSDGTAPPPVRGREHPT